MRLVATLGSAQEANSNMSTNLNLTDMETCYKAFRREVLEAIEIEENRFVHELFAALREDIAALR